MKKHTAMFLTFSALLTLNAFAPQVFWNENKSLSRHPANSDELTEEMKKELEVDKQEEAEELDDSSILELFGFGKSDNKAHEEFRKAEINTQNLQDQEEKDQEETARIAANSELFRKSELIAQKKDEAQALCLKDKQTASLESEILKLVSDKESILKEIEELKSSTKKKSKIDKEEKKAMVKSDNTSDVLGIMSQLTSLMISQQQQQMMMMNQMFSMFESMSSKKSVLEQYTSPYALNNHYFDVPAVDYSLQGSRSRIGLDPYADHSRTPSALDSLDFKPDYSLQMRRASQYPIPHDGFDFSQSTSIADMRRVQF